MALQRTIIASLRSGRRAFTTADRIALHAPPTLHEPLDMIGRKKTVELQSADDALERVLASGSTVFVQTAAATPTPLLQAMARVAKAKDMRDITVCHMHIEGDAPHLTPEYASHFRDKSWFCGGNAREAVAAGRADYVPIFFSEVPLLFRRGYQKINVALISVSPADAHGYHSLGVSVDVSRAALQVADFVVAMVNPRMPRVFGDGNVHRSHIDYVVPGDMPLHTLHKKEGGPVEEAIGKLIAENLVRDGATIQMGIGAIPDATLRYCVGHKDLGVHSEMFSDGVVDLVERGVITNKYKVSETGKLTGGFCIGTTRLYDFLHDNPQVTMLDISYVNDTAVIRRQPKMTAINSCIEVDITGQIVSDSIGTSIFSGVGGQMDFIRGAGLCPDGCPIIALPSTTRKGESRIVPFLKSGAGVVTTRAHVHYLVTEWGIAFLFGKTLRERAQAIIGVAHPDHRAALTAAAKARCLI